MSRMTMKRYVLGPALLAAGWAVALAAQDGPPPERNRDRPPPKGEGPPDEDRVIFFKGDDKGPPPPGPSARPGPGGPMGGGEVKLVARFDRDGDRRLNATERAAAREAIKKERPNRGFRMGPPPDGFPKEGGPFKVLIGPPGEDEGREADKKPTERRAGEKKPEKDAPREDVFGGLFGGDPPAGKGKRFFGPPMMEKRDPAKPGKKVAPADVEPGGTADLYDLGTLRTLFLDFESAGWEKELEDFHGTDVELPATLIVDGKKYPGVGVHFRGMSSYGMVPATYKRSLGVSVDFTDRKQRVLGRKTLNLLNAHEDPSMMGTVLYSAIARKYLPAPKANFVRVVINGESWGVYTNVEQFDKDFVEANFKSAKGHRWKVRGSPMGRGGLEHLGDDPGEYQRIYELKSAEDPKAWPKLIKLCQTLNEGPLENLEERLRPMLDLNGTLRFLAVENALVNCDGYWIRASDYSLVCDAKGVFHVVPHDMNEAFRAPTGPGMGPPGMGPPGKSTPGKGGPEKGGFEKGPGRGGMMFFGGPGGPPRDLDPLHGLDDPRKPLRSHLLAVPSLQARYLEYVRRIAREDLEPQRFGALVAKCKALIEKEVADDTKKLSSTEHFHWATGAKGAAKPKTRGFGMPSMSLLEFAEQRRKYLLAYKPPAPAAGKAEKTARGTE